MQNRVSRIMGGKSAKLQVQGGISRRDFMRTLGIIAAALNLPPESLFAAFTQSLAKTPKLPVIWLELQDCTGCTESLLRANESPNLADPLTTDPGIVDLLLDVISLEYHETVMAPSGVLAEKSREDVINNFAGQYVAIVEGSIPVGPTSAPGAYCTIGGKTALSIAQEVCLNAKATILVGTCATDGGLALASPNPTTAKSVPAAIPTLTNYVEIPGCPVNPLTLVSTICYYIAYNRLPSLDSSKRPAFAFGDVIHSNCMRRGKQTCSNWSDPQFRAGGCLKNIGCKGLGTRANCALVGWNGGTSYCTKAGHGCIACTDAGFWDNTFPMFGR